MTTVTTIHGDMDTSLLERKDFKIDNENELTQVIEYWLEEELVHRSVHVQLKKSVVVESIAAKF